MKVKLKLIFENDNYFYGTVNIPKKWLEELSLFEAIDEKVKCFNPKKVLIL